jgi:ABC-type anion transport system duplicated permease subunit
LISYVVANNVISQLKFSDKAIGYAFWNKGNLTTSLFAGLFFFVISEVFRIGTSLKEEQELTV